MCVGCDCDVLCFSSVLMLLAARLMTSMVSMLGGPAGVWHLICYAVMHNHNYLFTHSYSFVKVLMLLLAAIQPHFTHIHTSITHSNTHPIAHDSHPTSLNINPLISFNTLTPIARRPWTRPRVHKQCAGRDESNAAVCNHGADACADPAGVCVCVKCLMRRALI